VAETTVTADNVTVTGSAEIYAEAYAYYGSGNATATVDIDADGDVLVEGGEESTSYIWSYAYTYDDSGDATAETTVTADNVTVIDGEIYAEAYAYDEGDAAATVDIDADGDVIVGNDSYIYAEAQAYDEGDATATVDIQACGDVIVNNEVGSYADADESGNATADVIVKAFGNVIVNSGEDEEETGQIEAVASDGEENSAGITVLAVGDVIVNNGSDRGGPGQFRDSPEEIRALAENGPTNNAFVHIATRPGDAGNVEVSGQIGARTRNRDWPQYGLWEYLEEGTTSTNTSNVEIFAAQDVIVYGGYADIEYYDYGEGVDYYVVDAEEGGQITAKAQKGHINTANVDIFADRDVIVHGAELEFTEVFESDCADDIYFDGGQIIAFAKHGWGNENSAHVGIYAQRDVTIHDATTTGDDPPDPEGEAPYEIDGQVLATARLDGALTNDAEIEICAQDDVTVDGYVEALAEWAEDDSAHIRIWAGDLLGGIGEIIADTDDEEDDASITFFVTALGNLLFDGDAFAYQGETEIEPVVVVGPVDCPECDFDDWDWIDWDWCEDCEEEGLFAPVAALAQFAIPTIEGCPELMLAAAMELGITAETIQVGIGNTLALNPTIQPCAACAALIDAASILRDEDGSRMAAMVQTFNTLAPVDAPFTPGMAASIAMAFEGAAEGTQYASAMEYIDAFVQYVAVLDIDLGAPVGDSVAFVMDKYGAGIAGSDNGNIAAFVATRLEAISE